MTTIGLLKVVPVRKMRVVGGKRKLVVVLDAQGNPESKIAAKEVVRVTKEPLDGTFCAAKGHRLVVELKAGDVLALRPERTRQGLTAPLAEVYRWMVQRKANNEVMARLRERKEKKKLRLESDRIAAAERRLRRQARAACAQERSYA